MRTKMAPLARKISCRWLLTKLISTQLLLFVLYPAPAIAIQLPYGIAEGDEQLQFSNEIPILGRSLPGQQRFSFFERQHNSIFISAKGAISFGAPFETKANELEAERKDIIAVFYAPQSTGGKVFYRNAEGDSTLLAKELSANIRRAFGANQFEASAATLITWEDVQNDQGQSNTFQLSLATDSNETYALLAYGKLGWVKAGQRFAQAGFFSEDGRTEKLLNSGGPSVGDLARATNFNQAGLFLYRVSGSHPTDPRLISQRGAGTGEEEYEYQQEQQDYEQDQQLADQIVQCPPDPHKDSCPPNCNVVLDDNHCSLCICSSVLSENSVGSSYSKTPTNDRSLRLVPSPVRSPDLSCTPPLARAQCHANAHCLQLSGGGYCCECENGQFGNGAECLPDQGPLRINGFFEGALNGKQVQKTDLFAYIQPGEGQQHTAIARLAPEVGWPLLLLDSLATPFGWLFARRGSPANEGQQNGFQLTGANFTRTVNIHLGDRYALVIRQEFTDRQFSDHFSVNVFVSGTLPELKGPLQVTIPEFEETYRRERLGLIRSYSERFILLRQGEDQAEESKFRVTADQQIHFTECPHREPKRNTQTVKFERLNANYNSEENVARFASQSRILADEEQKQGAGEKGQQQQEEDIQIEQAQQHPGEANACSSGRHFCTLANMVCVPLAINPGYRCECRAGHRLVQDNSVEQGMVCQPEQPSAAEAEQLPPPVVVAERELQPGECRQHSQCHQWGECVFGALPGQPGKCKCRGWYVGDGVSECGPPPDQQQPQQASAPREAPSQYRGGTICRHDSECSENGKCEYSDQLGYYICYCHKGWRGDGVECTPEGQGQEGPREQRQGAEQQTGPDALLPPPAIGAREGDPRQRAQMETAPAGPIARKQCSEQSECHPVNGACLLDEQLNAHFCECLPGFQGDGVQLCERSEECAPTDPAQGCPQANQECQFEHSLQKFTCQCRNGFTKQSDGQCAHELGENEKLGQCRQCGANSQCLKGDRGEWNCICDPGFTGNGFECRKEANCLDEPTMCSSDAQCLPDGGKGYLCVCNYGFTGDGRTCEQVVKRSRETETLLIGRGMAIIQRGVQPTDTGKQLVVIPHQIVVDIEYDCATERIYWSDISGHSIRSAFLNGTDGDAKFAELLRAPEGIAIDWRSKNVYYLDSIKNELGVLSADGRFQKTLLKEGLVNPRALIADLEGRQLFYSDWSRDAPKIGRIGLDGSGNKVVVSDNVVLPNGLILLQQRRWLCWVDAGNSQLSCANLDGTGRRVVYAPLEYPFGLAVNSQEDRFYWTDWKDQKIHSVDVFGKDYIEFPPSAGGRGKLYGVLSLPTKCHFNTAPSECVRDNGGCAHWCLPGPRPGPPTCVCPDNFEGLEGC